jgi:prepilin signal peptidase PulO-like enzyme (type II secretory pathway)
VIGALLGWKAVLVSIFVGSLLGSVIGIAALSIARRRGRGNEPAATDADAGEADPPLRHAELPFGPFLVAGALFYLFAQSWIEIRFFSLYS